MADCDQNSEFGRIVEHGRILGRPLKAPAGTTGSVGYELGKCFQLDATHCLLVASMDEQGGGDMCVGNDGFVFSKLSDIRPEDAIAINRPDPQYKLKSGLGNAFLAKFPATGGFVPLGAESKDGESIRGEGTGLLISSCLTFNEDRTSAFEDDSEVIFEFMQLKWDGRRISVTKREMCDHLLGYRLFGPPLSYFYLDADSLLAPLSTSEGIVVFRFDFDGSQWVATESGKPFMICHDSISFNLPGELEPSIVKRGDTYLIYTRGNDSKGRVYASSDGLNYELLFERDNRNVPQSLNTGLDGSLYLLTNPSLGMLRNPLVAYPMIGESFGEAVVIHDEDGIRDDKGDKVPFIDHGVGVNLYLDGRWRHLLWYRVCDLKERSFHSFMEETAKEIHGADGPTARSDTGGLYLVEVEYAQVADVPFGW